jgi:phage-related protein
MRLRPSPSTAIAAVALFAALGGSSYAAVKVAGKDIRNGTVASKDVKDGSLTGADVQDDSLTGADLNESTLGQVPSANSANSANTANKANSADTATTANSATTATTANGVAANGVDTAAIQDNAVTSPKLGGSSVTASKLANTTDGITTTSIPAGGTLNVTATCPAGGQAITGGYFTPTTGVVQVTRMRRDTDDTWAFTFRNTAGTAQAVDARVTCLVG